MFKILKWFPQVRLFNIVTSSLLFKVYLCKLVRPFPPSGRRLSDVWEHHRRTSHGCILHPTSFNEPRAGTAFPTALLPILFSQWWPHSDRDKVTLWLFSVPTAVLRESSLSAGCPRPQRTISIQCPSGGGVGIRATLARCSQHRCPVLLAPTPTYQQCQAPVHSLASASRAHEPHGAGQAL